MQEMGGVCSDCLIALSEGARRVAPAFLPSLMQHGVSPLLPFTLQFSPHIGSSH